MADLNEITSVDELFAQWQEAHCSEPDTSYLGPNIPKHMFLPDGIIASPQFNKAKQKILFIAKEANWFQADAAVSPDEPVETMFWHREVAFGNVDKTQFSYRLSMLANAITSGDYTTVDKSHEILQSVAVVNLNKRGGYAYCVWDTLNAYVKAYQDYIRRQIDMIHPDLIVCCGYDVKWLLNEYNLAPNCSNVIWVYHPSYFAISDADYLDQLKCAMIGEKWRPVREQKNTVEVGHQVRGIIFDTNKTYSAVSTMDMLLSNKVSAYDDKAPLIDSFNVGDYVFFSVKGTGVVAAGKIISATEEKQYPDGLYEKYRVVDFIVPESEQIPHGEESLRGLSWSKIADVLGHGFFKARTDKRPYLTKAECEILIEELKKLNGKEETVE